MYRRNLQITGCYISKLVDPVKYFLSFSFFVLCRPRPIETYSGRTYRPSSFLKQVTVLGLKEIPFVPST